MFFYNSMVLVNNFGGGEFETKKNKINIMYAFIQIRGVFLPLTLISLAIFVADVSHCPKKPV